MFLTWSAEGYTARRGEIDIEDPLD